MPRRLEVALVCRPPRCRNGGHSRRDHPGRRPSAGSSPAGGGRRRRGHSERRPRPCRRAASMLGRRTCRSRPKARRLEAVATSPALPPRRGRPAIAVERSRAGRQSRAPVAALDADHGATRPAGPGRLPGADRLPAAARPGETQIHVVEVGVVAEPLPEARQVVGAAPVARRARDDEPATPEIAQALPQPVFAIGNAPTGIAAIGGPGRPGSRWPIGARGLAFEDMEPFPPMCAMARPPVRSRGPVPAPSGSMRSAGRSDERDQGFGKVMAPRAGLKQPFIIETVCPAPGGRGGIEAEGLFSAAPAPTSPW